MRDMVPKGDRSIRNIPLPHGNRRVASPHSQREEPLPRGASFDDEEDRPRRRKARLPRTFWLIASGVAFVAIVGALLLSTVFSGVTVVVYLRTQTVTPPATLEARLQAPAGMLVYQNMIVRRAATTTVAASGTAKVSRQAAGIITIYNTYGEASQRLIANTRFEAPDGKIYRVRDSITVPGTTKNADGSLKAGTITATVYADSPGVDYNRSAATRFTIPGFKGDPRYDKFYGQSQGPISGGFVGNEPAVLPAELAKAEAALKLDLDSALRAAATTEIPEGFISVSGSFATVYENIIKTPSGNNATLAQGAMATVAIIRADNLAAALAKAASPQTYKGEAVAFADPAQLTIALASDSKASTDGVLKLTLSGSPTLVWQFDPAAVKEALLGKGRAELSSTISSFDPAIVRASATIRPFWQGSFPKDPNKIKIVVGSSE